MVMLSGFIDVIVTQRCRFSSQISPTFTSSSRSGIKRSKRRGFRRLGNSIPPSGSFSAHFWQATPHWFHSFEVCCRKALCLDQQEPRGEIKEGKKRLRVYRTINGWYVVPCSEASLIRFIFCSLKLALPFLSSTSAGR